jgi:hypothetical protein
MIGRYAIKFGAAVSQKELEKRLHESGEAPAQLPDLKTIKARVEFIGDFDDLKKISELLKLLPSKWQACHPVPTEVTNQS